MKLFYSIKRGIGQSTLQNFAKCIFRPEKTLSTENASPRGSSFQSSRLRTFIFRLRVFSALSLLLQAFCVRGEGIVWVLFVYWCAVFVDGITC